MRVQSVVMYLGKINKSATRSELPLIWGIYAPKVSIPLEGKVPTSSGGPDLRSPTLGDKGPAGKGREGAHPSLGPLVQTIFRSYPNADGKG
jgi:hypothetical protein